MNLQEMVNKIHNMQDDRQTNPHSTGPKIPVKSEEGILPGYMKFVHPDGRVDVFAPNGQQVIEAEVGSESV